MNIKNHLLQGFITASKGETSAALETYIETGTGPLPHPVHLLNWDANSIHRFVFDTTNAAGIRGASAILREIDKDLEGGKAIGLEPEQVLFAGGGSGMAVVAAHEVEAVIDKLHRLFARRTLIATCSAASVLLDEHPFAERVSAVSRELANWRLRAGPDAEPMVPFFAERCEVCGRRAAALEKPRMAGRRKECLPCAASIDRSRIKETEEAQDFQEIAHRETGGYYAVLYADGNGVGKVFSKLTSPLCFATFSRQLNTLLREAFDEIKQRYSLTPEQSAATATRAHQLPICAGDDLVAILPGEIAVPVARDLLLEFERRVKENLALQELGAANLALSAGVAMGPVRLPVRHLLSEAEALLQRAKQRHYGHRPEGEGVSAVDFAVVRDGSPRAESNPSERSVHKDDDELLYSGRPYTLDELHRFSARCAAVWKPEIRKSQLYSVVRYAAAGPAQLRNHMLYQVARDERWRRLLEEMEKAEALQQPAESSAAERYMNQVLPTYGGRQVFDLGDMVELHRLWVEVEATR